MIFFSPDFFPRQSGFKHSKTPEKQTVFSHMICFSPQVVTGENSKEAPRGKGEFFSVDPNNLPG